MRLALVTANADVSGGNSTGSIKSALPVAATEADSGINSNTGMRVVDSFEWVPVSE